MTSLDISTIPNIKKSEVIQLEVNDFDDTPISNSYFNKLIARGAVDFFDKAHTRHPKTWNNKAYLSALSAKKSEIPKQEFIKVFKNIAPDGITSSDLTTIKSAYKAKISKKEKNTTQASIIFNMVTKDSRFNFGYDDLNRGYVNTQGYDGNPFYQEISSSYMKRCFFKYARENLKINLAKKTLEEVCYQVNAFAVYECKQIKFHLRTGMHENNLYISTKDLEHPFIKISKDTYNTCKESPIAFCGSNLQALMFSPEDFSFETTHEKIKKLFKHIHLTSVEDELLLISFLVSTLITNLGTFPILILTGEQGAGKSTCSRLIKSLVDPDVIGPRSMPKDERDLSISFLNTHLVVFDNISKIKNEMSDALCKVASGGAFVTRSLFTNGDEFIMRFKRPLIINGIDATPDRADLLDRSIILDLQKPAQRIDEEEVFINFHKDAPAIQSAIYDLTSSVLKNFKTTTLKDNYRLAGFAKIGLIIESQLGYPKGTFKKFYEENRFRSSIQMVEKETLICGLIQKYNPDQIIELSASKLLKALPYSITGDRYFPKTGGALGKKLKRLVPILREHGFSIDQHKNQYGRIWRIQMPPEKSPLWSIFPDLDDFEVENDR